MICKRGEPRGPLELQPEEELERFKFRLEADTGEAIVYTLFAGTRGVTVTRVSFTDASAWHVRRLRVGNRDQIVDPNGANAADIAGPIILERVIPGLVFSMNIRRAKGSIITDGEVVLYGRKHA